jgi:hypothetical protein
MDTHTLTLEITRGFTSCGISSQRTARTATSALSPGIPMSASPPPIGPHPTWCWLYSRRGASGLSATAQQIPLVHGLRAVGADCCILYFCVCTGIEFLYIDVHIVLLLKPLQIVFQFAPHQTCACIMFFFFLHFSNGCFRQSIV